MRQKSNNRNAVLAVLMLLALFAAVLAGSVDSRNFFLETSKRADSEKTSITSSPAIGQHRATSFAEHGLAATEAVAEGLGPINPYVVSGGGGTSVGVNFSLDGTVGEPSATNTLIGGTFTLDGGFWNVPQNFSTTPTPTPTPSPTAANGTISGRVLDHHGEPVAGVAISLTGTQNRKAITDAKGDYHFDNVETTGFYTVTPAHVNYNFNPFNRAFSQLGNHTEAAFAASASSTKANPLDTPDFFVRQHYLDFLGREPDEAGFNFWSDQILGCGSDAACIERRTINVSAAYFLSIEFQETGGLVDGLYRASFGRAPRFAEFMPDIAVLAQNVVVGKRGWDQQLAENKWAFIESFVDRAAFRNAYVGLTDQAYVDQLIAHTGVNYAANERDALVTGLTSATLTRAAALHQIVEKESFKRAKFTQTFVMMQYFGYLRRDPDENGYQFWLRKLNEFDGNFEQAEMVKAFITSTEYRGRFGQ